MATIQICILWLVEWFGSSGDPRSTTWRKEANFLADLSGLWLGDPRAFPTSTTWTYCSAREQRIPVWVPIIPDHLISTGVHQCSSTSLSIQRPSGGVDCLWFMHLNDPLGSIEKISGIFPILGFQFSLGNSSVRIVINEPTQTETYGVKNSHRLNDWYINDCLDHSSDIEDSWIFFSVYKLQVILTNIDQNDTTSPFVFSVAIINKKYEGK
jgi:hypothetical protein